MWLPLVWDGLYGSNSIQHKLQQSIGWDPLYGGEHPGRVGSYMRLTRANQDKEISSLHCKCLEPFHRSWESTQSPSDEAYMGGFTMRKPYGLLIEGLEYVKSPRMPEPMRPRHGQGIGDELTAVHLSHFLA